MVVTTELLRKSTMEVPRKKEATVSEEITMITHAACGKTAGLCTGTLSQMRTKLRDRAVLQARAGRYSQAALS